MDLGDKLMKEIKYVHKGSLVAHIMGVDEGSR
jgi:hypothetical protein